MPTRAVPAESGNSGRIIAAFAVCLTILLEFWPSLQSAALLALRNDRYLQVLLAPLACAALMFWNRAAVFADAQYSPQLGIPLVLGATLLGIGAVEYGQPATEGVGLVLGIAAAILMWFAGFVLCFGARSFWAGLYPLSCLLLMIPPPSSWMERVAAALQSGSAEVTYIMLRAAQMPVLRHGMDFSLRGLNFEIGPECSGIHSTLALLMVAIGAAYVYLRSGWARAVLILLTVPIVVVKNATRIVVITTLGAYVNRIFVDGPFHHKFGGLVFSVVGVTLLFLALVALRKLEARGRHSA
jgi:exosortase